MKAKSLISTHHSHPFIPPTVPITAVTFLILYTGLNHSRKGRGFACTTGELPFRPEGGRTILRSIGSRPLPKLGNSNQAPTPGVKSALSLQNRQSCQGNPIRSTPMKISPQHRRPGSVTREQNKILRQSRVTKIRRTQSLQPGKSNLNTTRKGVNLPNALCCRSQLLYQNPRSQEESWRFQPMRSEHKLHLPPPREPQAGKGEEAARVRGPSVRSGARTGPGRGNGGRVEEGGVRRRRGRPRGPWVSSQARSRARAHRSRYSPQPPPFRPVVPRKPEGS